MKRLLAVLAVLALSLATVSPVAAGQFGYRGGHARIAVRGGWGFHPFIARHPVFYRPRTFFSIGLGFPAYYYGGPAYYPPAPAYYPAPYPVWVPGHWGWDGGIRFWIGGHWSS